MDNNGYTLEVQAGYGLFFRKEYYYLVRLTVYGKEFQGTIR